MNTLLTRLVIFPSTQLFTGQWTSLVMSTDLTAVDEDISDCHVVANGHLCHRFAGHPHPHHVDKCSRPDWHACRHLQTVGVISVCRVLDCFREWGRKRGREGGRKGGREKEREEERERERKGGREEGREGSGNDHLASKVATCDWMVADGMH